MYTIGKGRAYDSETILIQGPNESCEVVERSQVVMGLVIDAGNAANFFDTSQQLGGCTWMIYVRWDLVFGMWRRSTCV